MKYQSMAKDVSRRTIRLRFITVLIFCLIFLIQNLNAQQKHFQTWFEYVPKFSLPKSFDLEFRAAYRTNFEDPRWHTYELRIQPEYKFKHWVTFMVALDFVRTHQNDHLTTFEIREALVAALHFTSHKRIQTGLTLRGEQRNVQDLETSDWTSSTRLRILGSVKAPLNKKSMSADHVVYALAEMEFFITPDDEIQERYANKLRVYAGMGYKVTHNLKLELIYMWQESKNTIHGDVSSAQNIFRFRVLQSFRTNKKNKTINQKIK